MYRLLYGLPLPTNVVDLIDRRLSSMMNGPHGLYHVCANTRLTYC